MKYKINLKKYYDSDELKKCGFIFNNENGRHEYLINYKPIISVKSWNYEFEFVTGLSKEEIPELVKVMIELNNYIEIEENDKKGYKQ